jgi:hypothetical protein
MAIDTTSQAFADAMRKRLLAEESGYKGTPVLAEDPLENGQWTGQFTGEGGNKGYQYYDANTGEYRKVPIDQMPEDGGWFINRDGEHVWGLSGDNTYQNRDGTRVEGKDPNPYVYNPANDDPNFTTGRGDTPEDLRLGGGYVDGGTGNNFQEGAYDPTEQRDYVAPNSAGDNTSWDWSQFQSSLPRSPDAPPYSANFTLGEDSPWGNAGTPGGNEDFYNKQFNNLTAQSQASQNGAISAAMRRQAASENRPEAPAMDWSWANNGQGLPTVQVQGESGGNDGSRYSLREGFDSDTTNYEIMQAALGSGWNDNDSGYPVGPNNPQLSGTNWANASNPNDLYASMPQGADETWAEMLRKGMNYAFVDSNIESPAGGGPVAAPGYASPIGSK